MKLFVERKWKEKGYTIGRLFLNGKLVGNTLEPEDFGLNEKSTFREVALMKVDHGHGKVAIPTGTYRIRMAMSPKFGKILPRLEGVTGFEGVLIHGGNTPKDTEGCILVGINTEKGKLLQSQATLKPILDELLKAVQRGEPIVITVR